MIISQGFDFTMNNKHYRKHATISNLKKKSFLLKKDAKNTNTTEFIYFFLSKIKLSRPAPIESNLSHHGEY